MFDNAWGAVRSGGFYVIEDLACTYNPAYTEKFRKNFGGDVTNKRQVISALLDKLMQAVDPLSSADARASEVVTGTERICGHHRCGGQIEIRWRCRGA
jgi:hypothetical protein